MSIVKIVFGVIIILLGLNYTGLFKLKILNQTAKLKTNTDNLNFVKSILFGMIFSLGWTPCVGAFLGSALMMVAIQSELFKGTLLLLVYSLGLGIPFILSAILIEKLKTVFDFIKKNYKIINIISGLLLIVMGIVMLAGVL